MYRLDDPDIMNVGTGEEISIRDLAERIARAAGFRGKINLETGIRLTIEEYRRLKSEGRIV